MILAHTIQTFISSVTKAPLYLSLLYFKLLCLYFPIPACFVLMLMVFHSLFTRSLQASQNRFPRHCQPVQHTCFQPGDSLWWVTIASWSYEWCASRLRIPWWISRQWSSMGQQFSLQWLCKYNWNSQLVNRVIHESQKYLNTEFEKAAKDLKLQKKKRYKWKKSLS